MSLLKPPRLAPGAIVGVAALASPVQEEFLAAGVAEIERLGFEPRLAASVYARSRYTAGDRSARLRDFWALWEDPKVAAVFCARGGYGTPQLLSGLDSERLRSRPKILLGSSDVTALLLHFTRSGLVSFHGPMVAQQMARGVSSYDRESLVETTTDPKPPERPGRAPVQILHPGAAEGTLVGGCLSLVASLVGTPFLPSFEDTVLFLEDTGVKPYQIDRLLTQLRLSGALAGVRGIVFGEMPGCEQAPGQGYGVTDVLTDLTADLGVPVAFGFPSGHTTSPAMTLPFGVLARLSEGRLTLLEGAVT